MASRVSLHLSSFARRLATVLRPYAMGCLLVSILVAFDAAFSALLGVSFGWLVDRALVPRNGTKLFEILGALVGGVVVVSAASVLQDYQQSKIGAQVAADLRRSLFDKLQALPLAWHQRARQGDLVFKFGGDITAVEGTITTILPTTLRAGLNLGFNLVLLFLLEWRLALGGLLLLPLTLVGLRVLGTRVTAASQRRQEEESKAAVEVQESLAAQPVVKAFGLEQTLAQRFKTSTERILQATVRASFLGALMNSTSFIEVNVLELAMIGTTCWFAFKGWLTIGEVVSFHALYIQVTRSMLSLAQLKPQVLNASTAMTSLDDVLREPTMIEPPNALPVAIERSIQFENVHFGYTQEKEELGGVSFAIENGQSIAFVGPSGSGKSTIVNLLLRFYDPKSGAITIDGKSLRDVSQRSLREKVGLVMQESVLFASSIRENIRIGRPGATDAEIIEVAKLAELHDVVSRLPHGYDTLVGERGARLSGGQRQRIAIARALIRNPSLLVLDEATSALDLDTEARLVDTLSRSSVGHTVLTITHRLGSVTRADCIHVMESGAIVETGTHDELLDKNGLYARLWRSQHGFVFAANEKEVSITPDRLRDIPLFAEVDRETLEHVSKLFTTEHHADESVVFREGDEADAFYVIVRGEATAESEREDGTQQRFAVMRDGDSFGEIGLLRDTTRTATVRTTTPCIFLALQREVFLRVVASSASLREKLDAMAETRLLRGGGGAQSRRQRPPIP